MAVVQPEMEGGLWMHGSPTDDWRLRGDPAEGEEEKEKPSSPQAAPTLRIEGGLPQDSRSKGKKKERAPKKFCLKDSDFLFFLNSDFSLKNPDIFPLKIPIPPLSNSIFFFKKKIKIKIIKIQIKIQENLKLGPATERQVLKYCNW